MRVTLRDVADRAGVSPRTVSNVVNGYVPVSRPLRERVEKAVSELGYRPNVIARNLRRGKTGLLALIVPRIDVPYFSELAREVMKAADHRGYHVMIGQTEGDHSHERRHLVDATRALMFDGLLYSPFALDADEIREAIGATPVVLLGEHIDDPRFDHVAIDNVRAAREATRHLIAQGRRRIAAIGRRPTGTSGLRAQGYHDSLAAAGLTMDDSYLVATENYDRKDGERAMESLLALPRPPDAVFCFSDLLALGAMHTLRRHGSRIPEDVALIGVDDIAEGAHSTPTLSTIAPDKRSLAECAIGQLVARIDNPDLPPARRLTPHTLIARASSTATEGSTTSSR